MPHDPVLVSGATGKQGGATVRALLAAGVPVRALVRDPHGEPARAVASAGAALVAGDLEDPASLVPAVRGAGAVFSVQMPPLRAGRFDFEAEFTQADNLVRAALAAGVPHFVQSTVTGAGQQESWPGWAEGRWADQEPYFRAKTGIQDRVREAGFARWTLLKPGTFMENFLLSTAYLLPRGLAGGLVTVLKPATRLALVAVDDIGRTAATAILSPERFADVELELAGDNLSMAEIAAVLSRVTGAALDAPDLTLDEALAAGMPPYAAGPHERLNVVGQPARPEFAQALGLRLLTFEDWARAQGPWA